MASIMTKYGRKREGKSHFVIIAPHGAGDDLKSGIIACRLARKLRGFLVINNKFKKPTNSNVEKKNEYIEDFNRLFWSTKINNYKWGERHPEMKRFFSDISQYCKQAKKYTQDKPVVIYIHSFENKNIGVDIGVGGQYLDKQQKLVITEDNGSEGKNKGKITAKPEVVIKIKKVLEEQLRKNYDLGVSIGQHYIGWSRQSAIQFHCHGLQDEYALQMEINQQLRKNNKNINHIVNILAEVL